MNKRLAVLGVVLIVAVVVRIQASRSAPQGGEVPAAARTYYEQATSYQRSGDTALAAVYYDSALAIKSDYADACEGLRRARPRAVC